MLLLWCSCCTWREGHIGNVLDRGRVDVVVDDKGLLLVRVLRDCHVVVCVPRLPLPLLDRVLVAAVVFQLHLEGGRHGDKDVDGGHVGVVDVDNGLLRSETNVR